MGGLSAPKLKLAGKTDEHHASIKISGTATDTGVELTVKPKADFPLANINLNLVPTIVETGFTIDSMTTTGQNENQYSAAISRASFGSRRGGGGGHV